MAMSGGGDDDEILSEMNVTPLVDVMLVLLVMFIVTASAVTTAVHVNLPKTDSVAPPDAKQPIVLSVDSDGHYFIDKNEVSLDELKQRLAQIHQKTPHRAAQLQADKDVAYGKVGKVMAALQASGIQKIAVLSKP
ncbi:Biopolymer transport protein ExbD/TolR [Salinisphaera sp. LB1]|nr:biopolymer transporter ExbD [Salinisphaera sp. LB1]AWN17884.1 Biopolymer transport protein ExbD/TolR [Salinisphaera sp. LB1]